MCVISRIKRYTKNLIIFYLIDISWLSVYMYVSLRYGSHEYRIAFAATQKERERGAILIISSVEFKSNIWTRLHLFNIKTLCSLVIKFIFRTLAIGETLPCMAFRLAHAKLIIKFIFAIRHSWHAYRYIFIQRYRTTMNLILSVSTDRE